MANLNALIFCERVSPVRETNRTDLQGVFTYLSAARFPCWLDFDIWVWLGAGGDDGSGLLEIICRKDGEDQWLRRVIEREINFEMRDEVLIRFVSHQFCFPRAGKFRFEVSFKRTIIGTQRLMVFQD